MYSYAKFAAEPVLQLPCVLIQLPLSRQDLAAMTGSTTETGSRVMSRLAEDGLVRSGRKWVAVMHQKGLEDLVEKGAVN